MDKYVVIVSPLRSVDKCLRIVEGTDMIPIQIRIKDFNMPDGASALVYAKAKGMAARVQTATINGNAVEFTPNKGFFVQGENIMQGRITKDGKDLITFAVFVICKKSIVTDDAEETNSDPTLLQQLLSEIEALKSGTVIIDTELSRESTNPPQNKAVAAKFDEISEKINAIKPLNAILYGFVPNNAEYDNSPLLQEWLDNLKKGSPALYFPAGVYYFKTPITFDKNGVGCTILGDSAPRDFVYISKVTSLPVAYNSSVLFFSKGNSTFFSQVSSSPITCKNLTFMSDSFKWTFNHTDWNTRPTVPYNIFSYEIEEGSENCNAIDVSAYSHCSFVDCLFYGFSGEAVKTTKQNTLNNCKITNCGTGIHTTGNDCTLYDVYISNCINGILHEASTIFAWNLWIDCCVEYAIKATDNLNGIIDCIIDHITYSAIYAKKSVHLRVSGRINRCGMYWCGNDDWSLLEDEDADTQFENFAKAATISIHTCHSCSFDIEAVNRGIADTGEQLYYTPNVMFNSVSWRQNNVRVPSDNIAVYRFWMVSPVIYKTAYTYAGFSNGASVDKLNRHSENGCYICAYKVNDITYVDVRGTLNNDSITDPFILFDNVAIALLQDIAPLKIPIIADNNILGALVSNDGVTFTYYNISGTLANNMNVQGHITSM